MEHVQSARHGDVPYHLEAAEEGIGRLFQTLALLLPGAYASYEGEPTDTILGQIEGSEE